MQIWIKVGIFAVIIVFVIIAVIVGNIFEKKRREKMRALAADLNFEFFEKGLADLLTALGSFHLFGLGKGRTMVNLMRGAAGGIELDIFDYRYVTGSGRHQQTMSHTVFAARNDAMSLPRFTLRPASFWSRVGGLLGYRDIKFDTHPKFSKLYNLKGADETAIREVFQPQVLEYFEEHPKLNVEAADDRLIYFMASKLAVEKIRDFMGEGFTVLSLFQPTEAAPAPAE